MDPLEPKKPRPIPPSPPRPEWLKAPPAAPSNPGVTPMMDFFQRRVEALERELSLERERAQAAQGLLGQQELLKAEVDAHLKAITDQLRREKGERESEEARERAHGRVEALEKRLDEMNATFAQLLREAVARREDGPSSGALAAELSAFRGALKDGMDGVARWRGELRELAGLVPQVERLTERLPQDEKLFEESFGRRLDEFALRLARTLEDWSRGQDAARAALDDRLAAMERERADQARFFEGQARALREEQFKDRVAREAEIARQVSELASRLEGLAASQDGAARGADEAKARLERVIKILTETPKAKDEAIAALEAERAELLKQLKERHEALARFAAERRDVEKSMGDGLLRMTGELESERARTRAAEAVSSERLGQIESLKARFADLERAVADRDARVQAMAAERDELARALAGEAEKTRRGLEERRAADEAADARLTELRRRLDEEAARRASAEGAAADARSQMGALAEQTARSLQERDATLARFSDWEKERQRLLDIVRKKDEMISLLSATLRGAAGPAA
jgi:DNA repair exonuclease SbcCD ATPase subunit